jgi:hypothetical protein
VVERLTAADFAKLDAISAVGTDLVAAGAGVLTKQGFVLISTTDTGLATFDVLNTWYFFNIRMAWFERYF